MRRADDAAPQQADRAAGALVFTSAELAFLAELLDGTFPGIVVERPLGPAVRQGLVRRGVLDGSGGVADDEVRTALRCALSGDVLALAACDGVRACSASFFAAAGSGIVRYEVDDAERHVLELADRETARAHLDEIVRALASANAGAEGPVSVESKRLSDVARLVARGDDAAARAALPEAPGYVSALSEVRLVATAAAHTRRGDDIEMTSVSVVHSPPHGLWLVEAVDDSLDEVAVSRVSTGDVARRLEALLDIVVALPAG